MSKTKLVLKLLILFVTFVSCNTGDKKGNFEKELDQYYAKQGAGIKELIRWIDANVITERSFVYNYRVRSSQVFCYYLDSDMRRGEYFELPQATPDTFITLLDRTTINNIVKIKWKDYYQVDIAAYSSWGYNVQILVFKEDKRRENKLDKLTKFIDSTADPNRWLYKEDNNFAYLISAENR